MAAKLIDGKVIAEAVRREAAAETERLKALTGQAPTLAAVLVGEDPASQTYVGAKGKACEEAGMGSITHRLPATANQAEVEALVRQLNADPAVSGILVQLPLPKGLNEQAVLDLISLDKDVDGFHPMNIGQLVMKGRTPQFIPCTPAGCIELLVRSGIPIAGKDAVVVGRSNIVGVPVAALLQNADATVTTCHSRTKDLPDKVRRADIVVAAIGKPEFVRGEWLKPGVCRYRRGHQPNRRRIQEERLPAGGRRELRRSGRGRGRAHACPRWRRADDDRHVVDQHGAGVQAATRTNVKHET